MIQHVLNMSNNKRNEIVAKMRREKLEFNVRCYKIEFETAKTKITCFNLNNCNCYIL